MKQKPTPPATLAELADRYQVSLKTIGRWRKRGAPLRDPAKLALWASAQQRPPAGLIARLLELRDSEGTAPKSIEPKLGAPDPDWDSFVTIAHSKTGNDNKASIDELIRAREFASFKLSRASESGDRPGQRFYTDLLSKIAATVHNMELLSQKLGRDLGDSYSGEDVDRLGRGIAFWTLASNATLISQLSSALTTAAGTGPLTREIVRHIVEPMVLTERMLAPLVRACQIDAGVALPQRFVDAVREGLASTLEDGAKEFNALYSQPVTPPTPPPAPPVGAPES